MQLLETSDKSGLLAGRVMQIKIWTVAVQLSTLIAASSFAIAQGIIVVAYRIGRFLSTSRNSVLSG